MKKFGLTIAGLTLAGIMTFGISNNLEFSLNAKSGLCGAGVSPLFNAENSKLLLIPKVIIPAFSI
jgi:hypothetical protein